MSITELILTPANSITEGLTRTLPDAPDLRWIQTFTGRAFYPLKPRAEDERREIIKLIRQGHPLLNVVCKDDPI